ncbi:MAG: pyridoxal phosphate-dependent aminotransferase [Planctomycetota bacterium]
MATPLDHRAARAAPLAVPNPLRALTEVIERVPGGLNLGQGVCDLPLPRVAADAVAAAVRPGERQVYTPYSGLPALREAIADALESWHGLRFGPTGVAVTPGSSGAFTATVLTLFDPGERVVLFEPFYSYHFTALSMLGLVPVPVAADRGDGWIDVAGLERAVRSGVRGIVINTPANPSGKVFSAEELEAIASAVHGSEVVLLTDEVYQHMVFDGREHVPPARLPELARRSVTISSFSKTFSITGWRIGFVAGPRDVVDAIGRTGDQAWVCASRPAQIGTAAALRELPQSFYRELSTDYQARRDRLCAALAAAGFQFQVPAGAYYVLADYRKVLGDAAPMDAAHALIDKVRINAVPGHLFGTSISEARTLRFHFAVADEVLDEACRRLATLLGAS